MDLPNKSSESSSESYATPDDQSSCQDPTEIPTTSHYQADDLHHHSRGEESLLFSEIEKVTESSSESYTTPDESYDLHRHSRREESLFSQTEKVCFIDTGSSDNTTSTDSASDTESDKQYQTYRGKGRKVFTRFTSEWSSLLDNIEDSVEKVSKNYEGWRPETVAQQSGSRRWPHQSSDPSIPGTSKSSVHFMTEEQADKWASAPEFHPAYTSRTGRVKTYAEAVDPFAQRTRTKLATGVQFCPYFHENKAELYICPYLHGELCQICYNAILDFEDTAEKREHLKECRREQENRMKVSLAIQKSKGITCHICLEAVKEKNAGEARFGLLPNCNHCFCITCIRKWRQETKFTSQITRSCPICRVESPFVCPSSFWVETAEDKAAVISNYKQALRVKPCRLYNYGRGKCPFGDKCFYLHILPDGRKPEQQYCRRPMRLNAEGIPHFQEYVLWDFIAKRDDPEHYQPSMPARYPASLDSSAESDSS